MRNLESLRTVGIVGGRQDVTDIFSKSLVARGFIPSVFPSIEELTKLHEGERPEMIIVSGKKALTLPMPKIILGPEKTGAAEAAFESGALDYISTAHPPQDVADYTAAKIQRIFERNHGKTPEKPITIGEISVDPERMLLVVDKNTKHLEKRCLLLLIYLMQQSDQVVTRKRIRQLIREKDFVKNPTRNDISVRIVRIRSALGDEFRDHLETVRKVGYRFVSSLPNTSSSLQ